MAWPGLDSVGMMSDLGRRIVYAPFLLLRVSSKSLPVLNFVFGYKVFPTSFFMLFSFTGHSVIVCNSRTAGVIVSSFSEDVPIVDGVVIGQPSDFSFFSEKEYGA